MLPQKPQMLLSFLYRCPRISFYSTSIRAYLPLTVGEGSRSDSVGSAQWGENIIKCS